MKFRMIDLGHISSNAPQTNVFLKLIIVEVFRKHIDIAGEKSAGRLKCIRFLPGGQVPQIFYIMP